MRLPIAIPLDTRDGTLDQDGHLTNAVAESYEDKVYVSTRPGLSLEANRDGAANGIFCFDGTIITIWGTTIEDYVPASTTAYNAGTTYSIFDTAIYLGTVWLSLANGNQGNTPAYGSDYWSTSPANTTWQDSTEYDIGSTADVFGITYYSLVDNNIGTDPVTYPNLWSTSSPGSSRFTSSITVTLPDGFTQVTADGQTSATATAAGYSAYLDFPYIGSCSNAWTNGVNTPFWWEFLSASVASGVTVKIWQSNNLVTPCSGTITVSSPSSSFGSVTQLV
jgi:hypothetical protein